MLEEQSSEFSAKSAPVKGHLKVETGNNKGALRCVVQNLRYYDRGEYIYKLILFGTKNERIIHSIIGTLLVNRQGSGETYFRFQPLDVDGKGNQFHDFSSAIVAAVSTVDDKESLHPVLRGTIRSDVEPFKYEQRDISAAFLKNEKEEVEEKLEPVEELGEAEKEATQLPREDDKRDEGDNYGKEEVEKEENRNFNNFYNRYILNACAHTCRVAEFYEDVNPFDVDKTGAIWKKIVNVASLPLVSPGAHYFATQYKHFIFGAKPDDNGNASKFYFGIPGRYLNDEQPDGGDSGFRYWQPIKGMSSLTEGTPEERAEAQRTSYGYWIIAIDAATGDIKSL